MPGPLLGDIGQKEKEVLSIVVQGLVSGLDDLTLIVAFLMAAQPTLKLLWQASQIVHASNY